MSKPRKEFDFVLKGTKKKISLSLRPKKKEKIILPDNVKKIIFDYKDHIILKSPRRDKGGFGPLFYNDGQLMPVELSSGYKIFLD